MDIAAWLRELGLERYEQAFRENDIDAEILPKLTTEDLISIGVASVGHRRKLLEAIAELSAASAAAEAADATQPQLRADVAGPPEAERRQLTVLFCDLVGSTELASRIDPEDMGALMRAYHTACQDVVTRWGGHVAKFMGDGVLAYFGYPRAHEDDAERAVRASIDLAAAIEGLKTENDASLAGRIGIATGLVMVGELIGEGAAQEHTVVGETPNLAARLQALAAPGAVVVAAGTRRLLGGLFELEDLGRQSLKGFGEPVRAFRVVAESRVESRFEALHGRHLTPLVGREHELGLLLERFERAKEGEGQVVLLSGEPGIGKSRIARALRERLENEPHTPLSHYCSPHHVNSVLHPVIGLLQRGAGLARNDPPAVKLDKLEALLARGTDDPARAVPLVAALLGISASERYPPLALAPQEQKQRTLEILLDQVAGLARQQPLLIVHEDVHWLDPTTLELLDLLVDRIEQLPALVLMTFRPEFSPPWTGRAHLTQLSLSRLVRRHGSAIVTQITGGKPLPQEVLAQILERTDGVPLFVEELTKTVLESGRLKDQGDRYELDGNLPPLAIPSSLQDSLMARLDRLAQVKEMAQIGAVIGREFSHELIAAVADRPEDQLRAALDQLVASELVFGRGVRHAATYTFKHALVQDTAYQSLLKSKRQQLHARIARSLEERFPSAVHTEPEVLARHYTHAGRVPEAISYWLRAGRKAAERSADREAAAHLTQGLELVEHLPNPLERATQELDLRIALGAVMMNIRGSAAPEVAAVYERAQELCREVGRPEQAFPVLWGLWHNRNMSGRLGEAQALAKDLIGVADDLPETVFRLQGHHSAWTTHAKGGELAPALEHVEQGLAIYDADQHAWSAFVYGGHDAGVCAYSVGALIRWELGYPDRALHLAQNGVTLARRLGHPFSSAHALCFKAILHQLRGEPGTVAEQADELLALCTEHGLEIWSRNGRILKGWTLAASGEVDEGLALFEQAIEQRRASGAKTRQAYYLALQAEALCSAGQPKKGLDTVTEALEFSRSHRRWEAVAHRVRGDLLLTPPCRDEAAAEAALRRAVEVARGQEAKSFELRAATSLARLLVERGERQKAHDLLAPIYDCFTEGFDTADLKRAKALLAELR